MFFYFRCGSSVLGICDRLKPFIFEDYEARQFIFDVIYRRTRNSKTHASLLRIVLSFSPYSLNPLFVDKICCTRLFRDLLIACVMFFTRIQQHQQSIPQKQCLHIISLPPSHLKHFFSKKKNSLFIRNGKKHIYNCS